MDERNVALSSQMERIVALSSLARNIDVLYHQYIYFLKFFY